MHFSKIYVQKNFVPDIVTDQFGRESIGIEVTLDENDDIENARELAQQYVKEYIQKNTVVSHAHIEEKYIPESQLPTRFVDYDFAYQGRNELPLEDQIMACTQMAGENGLYSFLTIAKMNKKLMDVYTLRQEQIQQLELQAQTK